MIGAPELSLEPLRWWDLPTVVRIEHQLFPTESPWSEGMFWSELAQQNHLLAAWDGPDLVGYCGLAVLGDEAHVQTMALLPSHQGLGLGRRMLTALVAHADGRPIHLEVRTDNAPAVGLYQSMGFTRIGIRRRYYQPSGADAYTMVREQ